MTGEARKIGEQWQASPAEHMLAVPHCHDLRSVWRQGTGIRMARAGYQEGTPDLIELNSEPVFDGVRDEPKFSELMRGRNCVLRARQRRTTSRA